MSGRPRLGLWLLGLAFVGGVGAGALPTASERPFPSLPAAMAEGDSRVDVIGADVSKAGGSVIVLEAAGATYRQTCLGVCDQVLINFGADGESLYRLRVLAADGRVVFENQTYVDGDNWDRLGGEPLALQRRLVEVWPYGRRVRPAAG